MEEINKQLAKQFRNSTEELVQLIEKFDNESFNRKPANGGWNAGEVAEHLLLFDIRLNKILETATHATDRDIAEKEPIFITRLGDRKNKIDAPPFLVPSPGIKSVSILVDNIKAERSKITRTIEENDLSLHSKEFPHRFFGEMTVLEWIKFIDLHAKRHMEQLDELLSTADGA